ncbi:hypothetical protein AB0D10_33395, partial [Kitasatospora sp. NPDC048545]|uniref:hypothetical protein n=1 Tax=Kitasatospora sp. NPDC048545 TaxID=3157208 RepID=UPI0033F33DC4
MSTPREGFEKDRPQPPRTAPAPTPYRTAPENSRNPAGAQPDGNRKQTGSEKPRRPQNTAPPENAA